MVCTGDVNTVFFFFFFKFRQEAGSVSLLQIFFQRSNNQYQSSLQTYATSLESLQTYIYITIIYIKADM